jgi:chromosome segregation ATPase
MALLDEYLQNSGGDDDTDPGDLRRKRAEINRQVVISESNLKKVLRERDDLEIEQRRLRKSEERIRVERDALDGRLKKVQDNQRLLEEEIKGLKKELKVLQ